MKKLLALALLLPRLAFADGFFGGGGGSAGPTATPAPTATPVATPAITANTLAKGTFLNNSAITDDGAGAIGFYPAAAAPQAVTETYASVVTGTTDTAGAATTTKLSASTGSGVGGTWSIQNTNKAGTGNTPNTYGTVLSLSPPNTGTTAPVNYLDIKNAITGSGPSLTATGTDSNIVINLVPKGTGGVVIPLGTAANPGTQLSGSLTSGLWSPGNGFLCYANAGVTGFCGQNSANGYFGLKSTATIGWANTLPESTAADLLLGRDNAAILQMGLDAASPVAQTFKGADTSTNGNAGGSLTVKGGAGLTSGAGGALSLAGGTSGTGGTGGAATIAPGVSAGTDIAAGAMTIKGGTATGAAVPGPVSIQTGNVLGTGSTAHTLVDREIIGNEKVVSNNSATAMVNVTVANDTVAAVMATYSCQVKDASDVQIEEGSIVAHVTNDAGAIANNTVVKYGNQQAMTGGSTLTVTWTITAANPAVLTVNCNSSLTPSTGFPKIRYNITNLTDQAIAVQ